MSKQMGQCDLLAIGNLTFDVITEVDRIPEIDETGQVLGQNIFYGGRAGNIAVIASNLGLDVAIASIVGDDFLKKGYKDHLLKHKVNSDRVRIIQGQECPKTQVFMQRDGKHLYFFQPNLHRHAHKLDLEEEALKEFKVIYLTSFNSEKSIERMIKKLKHFDNVFFGLGEEIYRKSKGFLRSAIEISSFLGLNKKEYEVFMKRMSFSTIDEVFGIGTKLKFVSVSLGEKGSIIYTSNKELLIPPVPPVQIVSTLGAGDAYVAGLIYGIINEWDIEECGRLGSALSSFVLEEEGAQNKMPDWKSLRKRYNQHFGESP